METTKAAAYLIFRKHKALHDLFTLARITARTRQGAGEVIDARLHGGHGERLVQPVMQKTASKTSLYMSLPELGAFLSLPTFASTNGYAFQK